MDQLTAAQHRRRQIIFGIVLTILIPIVNQFLNRWGLPSLPLPAASPPGTISSSGGITGELGSDADARFFLDGSEKGNLVPCGIFCRDRSDLSPRPRLQFRRPLRFNRRELRRSPQSNHSPTIPVELPSIPCSERIC